MLGGRTESVKIKHVVHVYEYHNPTPSYTLPRLYLITPKVKGTSTRRLVGPLNSGDDNLPSLAFPYLVSSNFWEYKKTALESGRFRVDVTSPTNFILCCLQFSIFYLIFHGASRLDHRTGREWGHPRITWSGQNFRFWVGLCQKMLYPVFISNPTRIIPAIQKI